MGIDDVGEALETDRSNDVGDDSRDFRDCDVTSSWISPAVRFVVSWLFD